MLNLSLSLFLKQIPISSLYCRYRYMSSREMVWEYSIFFPIFAWRYQFHPYCCVSVHHPVLLHIPLYAYKEEERERDPFSWQGETMLWQGSWIAACEERMKAHQIFAVGLTWPRHFPIKKAGDQEPQWWTGSWREAPIWRPAKQEGRMLAFCLIYPEREVMAQLPWQQGYAPCFNKFHWSSRRTNKPKELVGMPWSADGQIPEIISPRIVRLMPASRKDIHRIFL